MQCVPSMCVCGGGGGGGGHYQCSSRELGVRCLVVTGILLGHHQSSVPLGSVAKLATSFMLTNCSQFPIMTSS